MKKIKLNNGQYVLIDDEYYEELTKYKWYLNKLGYATTGIWCKENKKTKQVLLHKIIMNTPKGYCVDHINGNKLDNRRLNLRLATIAENVRNQKRNKSSISGYKGVQTNYSCPNRPYEAAITFCRKQIHILRSADKEECAWVYDQVAMQLFGEFANPNFGGWNV